MFLIDFEKKGNVIRLYFGEDDQYWGDDWNDAPYEHNAGQVYDKFVKCYIEYAFPLNYFITEPADDYHYRGNSPYSKQSMRDEKCPCLIITKDDENYSELFLSYSILLSGEDKEIRRQNEIPSFEHLEEGIHALFVNRTIDASHGRITWRRAWRASS